MRYSNYVQAPLATAVFLLLQGLFQPLPAEASEAAIGHAGQLQRAVAGTYGNLFENQTDLDANTPILALDILLPGAEPSRLLVPGTGDPRIEAEPILVQDTNHDSLILLWQSRATDDVTYLRFAHYDGSEWSQIHTLEADETPLPVGQALQVAESRDAFELDLESGETIQAERHILHVLWRAAGETPNVLYAPLTFVEGRYLGWHNLLALNNLFLQTPAVTDDDEEEEVQELSATLAETLSLTPAADNRSVLVTFANPTSHRLGTLEISPLPLSLGLLGEQVRDQIFALAEVYDPNDLESFSDQMRAAIIIMGSHFQMHEAYGDYVAGQVADWIQGSGGTYGWDLQSLGNDARDLTIEVSNEVYASTRTDPADPGSEIIEIDVSGMIGNDESDPAQTLDFLVRADLPAPAVGAGPTTVYTSRNGRAVLIAWENVEDDTIHWVESLRASDGATWSEPFSLTIGDDLSLAQAHQLLAAKLR